MPLAGATVGCGLGGCVGAAVAEAVVWAAAVAVVFGVGLATPVVPLPQAVPLWESVEGATQKLVVACAVSVFAVTVPHYLLVISSVQ